jgi:mRNA interferase RelE/StbE
MKLDMTRDASKFLEDLSKSGKQYVQVVRKVLALMKEPRPSDSEAMQGSSYFRVDSGEYRIVYEIDTDVVNIILVGKRNGDEVYDKLKRK